MKRTLKGDLVNYAKNGHFDVIIHGQNCIHGWKKGIAHTIGLNFPAAKKADLATLWGDKKKLGTFSHAEVTLENGAKLIVVNAYTQYKFGAGKHLNMRALESAFEAIKASFPGMHIAYPKIGAGHAGGDWKEISAVIDRVMADTHNTLVVF